MEQTRFLHALDRTRSSGFPCFFCLYHSFHAGEMAPAKPLLEASSDEEEGEEDSSSLGKKQDGGAGASADTPREDDGSAFDQPGGRRSSENPERSAGLSTPRKSSVSVRADGALTATIHGRVVSIVLRMGNGGLR